jgi:hypothetical protein
MVPDYDPAAEAQAARRKGRKPPPTPHNLAAAQQSLLDKVPLLP